MSPEQEHFPGDEPPQDPAAREQWRQAMPSEEEILNELDDRMDKPITVEEQKAGAADREVLATYRAAHEQEEKEKAEAESLEKQIETVSSDLNDLYENLNKRLEELVEEGHEDVVHQYQSLIELEWSTVKGDIAGASPRAGYMGMRYTPPESKRWELLGALKHSFDVMTELKKQIAPSESGVGSSQFFFETKTDP